MSGIGLVQNSQKSAKQMAIDAAKKIAREPLEMLKTAREQTTGVEQAKNNETHPNQQSVNQDKSIGPTQEYKKRIQAQRMMEAFEKELQDIRNQKKQEEMQNVQQEQIQAQQVQQEKKQGLLGVITAQAKKRRGIGQGNKKGSQPPGNTNKTEAKKP